MGEGSDSAPFERFNIDVNLLLIPGILLVIFVGMASSLNILCLVRQLSLHVIVRQLSSQYTIISKHFDIYIFWDKIYTVGFALLVDFKNKM